MRLVQRQPPAGAAAVFEVEEDGRRLAEIVLDAEDGQWWARMRAYRDEYGRSIWYGAGMSGGVLVGTYSSLADAIRDIAYLMDLAVIHG